MSYNTELQSNNMDLQTILNTINNLPDAGSGEPNLQSKTVSPSTSQQTVTPDSGYDGLSQVIVNAMSAATQATPSISVSSSGLITASSTQSAGYVASGTKSATKQLTTQAAKTITPSTSSQTAVAKNVYTTGDITVAPIPSDYEDVATETNAYTALLPELESVINGLPSAGEGSGSSGSIQVAKGTITGTSFLVVNDLTFKPKYVEVMAMSDTSTYNASSGNLNYLVSARIGNLNGFSFNEWVFYRQSMKYFTGNSYPPLAASITFNDNGFNVTPRYGTLVGEIMPVTYSYVAIG